MKKRGIKRVIEHIKLWNKWRKHCVNGKWHKFLVLIGVAKSSSLKSYYMIHQYMKGLNEGLMGVIEDGQRNIKAVPAIEERDQRTG